MRVLVLVAFILLAACSSRAPDPMPSSGLVEFSHIYDVERVWTRKVGRGIGKAFLRLPPAVTDDQIVVATFDGVLKTLNRETGKPHWRLITDDRISAGVVAAHGRILYGTREGHAVARSPEDGRELWRTPLGSELLSPPAADSLMAVFMTLDGRAVALDLLNGDVLWSFDSLVPVLVLRGSATPVIAEGRVFVAFANGRVMALDPSTGAMIWERRVAEPHGRSELDRLVDVNSNLIVQGGGVFASSFQGRVMVLDIDNGQPFWGNEMSTYGIMSSEAGTLFVADSRGHVWALDQRSGNDLWRQAALSGRQLTGTAVVDGRVAVGDRFGFIHWLDARTGALVARQYHIRRGFAAAPVADKGVLYVYGRKGRLTAYRLVPRQPWWRRSDSES